MVVVAVVVVAVGVGGGRGIMGWLWYARVGGVFVLFFSLYFAS